MIFGVVDPLEVDRSDAEVAVAELALDDDQRYALASGRKRSGRNRFAHAGAFHAMERSGLECCFARRAQATAASRQTPAVRPWRARTRTPLRRSDSSEVGDDESVSRDPASESREAAYGTARTVSHLAAASLPPHRRSGRRSAPHQRCMPPSGPGFARTGIFRPAGYGRFWPYASERLPTRRRPGAPGRPRARRTRSSPLPLPSEHAPGSSHGACTAI
jgi:hypothetical protein